ncbi:DUF2490 domain-containing protein [Hymenobacter sp. APR13]|uniref:DUF2490 domain-containing protein n=1 Tax=Hymenobacter sp. APR13 TaxID=1356852 RepID=UPI0009DD2C79|nr:DUF2490 domain-containing protein [Hymenobacter sp. APR13]
MTPLLPVLSWKQMLAVLALTLAAGTVGYAQRPVSSPIAAPAGANTWLTFLSDARLSQRWGLHLDGQLRRAKDAYQPQQLARIGINYHVAPALQLTAGYARASSYFYNDYASASPLPEHRLYQQVLLREDSGRVHTQHRYRLEQRWVRRPGDARATYLNRMRYQLRLVVPLGHKGKLEPGTPYLAGADELFLGFGASAGRNFFEQNRAYLAFGYQFTRAVAIEAGYQHQMVQPAAGYALQYHHTLQLALSFQPDLRRGLALASAL